MSLAAPTPVRPLTPLAVRAVADVPAPPTPVAGAGGRRAAGLALVAALAWLSAPWRADPAQGPPDGTALLHGVSLAMHETGHLVFAPFGEAAAALGGTLLQCLLPLAFAAEFARRRHALGAAVALWWAAQNGWDVAVYVADARAQALPLVGGGEHDWAYLLARWGVLARDVAVARAVHAWSSAVAFAALAAAGLAAWFGAGAGGAPAPGTARPPNEGTA